MATFNTNEKVLIEAELLDTFINGECQVLLRSRRTPKIIHQTFPGPREEEATAVLQLDLDLVIRGTLAQHIEKGTSVGALLARHEERLDELAEQAHPPQPVITGPEFDAFEKELRERLSFIEQALGVRWNPDTQRGEAGPQVPIEIVQGIEAEPAEYIPHQQCAWSWVHDAHVWRSEVSGTMLGCHGREEDAPDIVVDEGSADLLPESLLISADDDGGMPEGTIVEVSEQHVRVHQLRGGTPQETYDRIVETGNWLAHRYNLHAAFHYAHPADIDCDGGRPTVRDEDLVRLATDGRLIVGPAQAPVVSEEERLGAAGHRDPAAFIADRDEPARALAEKIYTELYSHHISEVVPWEALGGVTREALVEAALEALEDHE